MTQTIEEQVSALLDGELPIEEEELLLRRLRHEPKYRETLARFSLIGESLRGTLAMPASMGLGDRVSRLVDEESVHGSGAVVTSRGSMLRTGFAGAAIAATIAVVAIVSLNRQAEAPGGIAGPELAGIVETPANTEISYTVPASSERSAVIAPARLTGYLVSHGEYTSGLSRQIMNSYVVSQAPHTPVWDASEDAIDD